MEKETDSRLSEGAFRLSTEQQAEIGDILLSARAVSRQMVSQAKEQSDELLRNAQERAEELVREAEEKAAGLVREAEEKAAAIAREAEEKAAALTREAEEKAAALTREAEQKSAGPAMTAEMQEYMVLRVGDCFSRLRRQQLDAIDLINEQWRSFLSGLTTEETPPAASADSEGIRQEDIETRVSAIAKELMDMNEE